MHTMANPHEHTSALAAGENPSERMQDRQSRQDKGLEQCSDVEPLPQPPRTGRAMDSFTAGRRQQQPQLGLQSGPGRAAACAGSSPIQGGRS